MSATTSSRYSPSIDGLRAVAVLLVLGVHVFPEWVKGGFVGVDIFFVISGYLISGLLFKDLAQDRFSLRHFYARRIRRIFPALSVVLLACLGIGGFLLTPQEYQELGKHVAGGAGFIANLLLWQEAGYFDGAAKTKVLLHLWSLGIEEQFYIFWPLLLFVTRKGRRRIPLTLGAVIVFSFVFNVVWIHKDSVATFYAPLTRVWELALGGFLAWGLRYDQGGPHPKRQAWCQIFGLVLLSAAVALLDEKSLFPGWWALLPTLGAMAIIAAGDGAWFNRWVLSNPLAVGIGVISYPLYLWHWPLLVFARQSQLDITSPGVRLSLVGASFVLATLTYFLVEKPIRFGRSYPRARVIGLACVMAVIGLTGLGLYQNGGAPGRFSPALQKILTYRYDSAAGYLEGQCFLKENKDSTFGKCHFGLTDPKAPSLFLWGDSHAAHLIPGLLALRAPNSRLSFYTAGGCPPILDYDVKDRPNCLAINHDVWERLRAEKPHQVILAAVWGNHRWKALGETIARLKESGVPQIVVVGQVPIWIDSLPKGIFRFARQHPKASLPVRLKKQVSDGSGLDSEMKAFVEKAGAVYVSPWEILCNQDGCQTGVDQGEILAWDYGHFTLTGSKIIVQQLPAP